MSNKKTITIGNQKIDIDNSTLNIVTHNGTFHTDEVTAFTLLNYLFSNTLLESDNKQDYLNIKLTRTRSPDEIKKGNIVIDVGQVYDAKTNRFDHHQSTFDQYFDSVDSKDTLDVSNKFRVKLSSAGLIYKHFGQAIIDKFCKELGIPQPPNAHNDFYYKFICEIDASDNGITQYGENFYEMLSNKQIKTKYSTHLSLGQVVSGHNCMDTSNETEQMVAFHKASQYVLQAFRVCLEKFCLNQMALINDMEILKKIVAERKTYHPSGELLVVKEAWSNWRKCIEQFETQNPTEPKILFLVYPASENKLWNIRTISDKLFTNRLDLLKKDVLQSKVSKPNEITFVHNALFIAACQTLETAIAVGVATLNNRPLGPASIPPKQPTTVESKQNDTDKCKCKCSCNEHKLGTTTTTTTTTNSTTTTTTTITLNDAKSK